MATTTVRVDTETHARLLELSRLRDASVLDTVRAATAALHREQFAHRVADEIAELRGDPAGWAAYLADSDATEVTDGVT